MAVSTDEGSSDMEAAMRLATEATSSGSSVAIIACDWNGTLVDDAQRACAATNDVLTQLGLSLLDQEAFRTTFVLPLDRYFAVLGVPTASLEWAELVWNQRLMAQAAHLRRGATAFLSAAGEAQIPVGIVSAAATDAVERDAEQLGVRSRLAFVTGGVRRKREELRRLVESGSGVVLYVGDTEYDIEEALAAGATPVGVTWGYRPAEALVAAGATVVLQEWEELATLAIEAMRLA